MLTDLLLPDLDGVAVTQRLRAELPETQVVVLTSVSDQNRLTDREREVLLEIASDRMDKEIARSLSINLSTVKTLTAYRRSKGASALGRRHA